jgi:hypothetical protein
MRVAWWRAMISFSVVWRWCRRGWIGSGIRPQGADLCGGNTERPRDDSVVDQWAVKAGVGWSRRPVPGEHGQGLPGVA